MRKYIWNLFTWFVETISPRHTFHAHFSLLFTVGATAAATLLSALYHRINPSGVTNISLIYILTIILISCYTDKYRYGILAAIFSVFCINYLYTYPFHEFNFTMTGYPFTFLVMYFISIMTSATTFHTKAQASRIKEDEKLIMEAEKEKLRANLLRAVSHDLRTPLTSMIGASSSYLENEEMLPVGEKRELVAQIYEDANWLLHMVENLLSVTRITEGGSNVLKKSPEAAEEVLFDAITTARKRYPEQQIHALIPDDFLIAPMDPLLIKQVILNFLENSYYHARSTRPVECRLEGSEHVICIRVRDFGAGIPPEKLSSIFDAAPSAPTSAADTRKGMGIGLSICKAIVSAHGGEIGVRNHPDGAEFYFTLPKEDIHHESDDQDPGDRR
ncbi:MAG: PAS domain-containing sensor histidine kinase [Lachnospiraceae bacterium]|nr:PAS domain-containing sensor histidine kinase [Lachnospiraceae bacterium]